MARRLYVDEREQSVDLLAVDDKGTTLVLPEEWAKEREVVVIHAHAGREPHVLRDTVDVHNVLLVVSWRSSRSKVMSSRMLNKMKHTFRSTQMDTPCA